MGRRWAVALAAMAMAVLVLPARAQEAVLVQPNGEPVQVILAPLTDEAGVPIAPLAADPAIPPLFTGALRVDIGFKYLRPDWSNRTVGLTVPAGAAGSFPGFATSTNLSNDFAFVPRFGLDYQFPDQGFGLGASGELMTASGHVRRTIDSTAGTGLMTAQGSVDVAVANFVEGTKLFALADVACCAKPWLEDTTILATVGLRYNYVRQNYTASLQSGQNIATLTATQEFTGFGLTSSWNTLSPLGRNFAFYTSSRGSILVGPNDKASSATVVTPANAATSSSTVVTENRTTFVPVGEFEIGIAWGTALLRTAALAAAQTGPLLWLKIGLIGQIYGNLGFLSASSNPQHFGDENLFLYGFSVLAGIDF